MAAWAPSLRGILKNGDGGVRVFVRDVIREPTAEGTAPPLVDNLLFVKPLRMIGFISCPHACAIPSPATIVFTIQARGRNAAFSSVGGSGGRAEMTGKRG